MLIGPPKLPVLVALIKGDPLVNVAGAYFPAWLGCMAAGLLGAWAAQVIAEHFHFEAALRPAPLMLTAVFVAVTCGTWLLVFSAR